MRPELVILDLDGVVYIGPDAVEHAIPSLNSLAAQGVRLSAGTNNASRPATVVAEHLQQLGLHIAADDVMTSAQAAASQLARRLPAGAPVLAVGGDGVSTSLSAQGLRVLRASSDIAECNAVADECDAVVVGYGPLVAWFDLAAAHWAIERGKYWVATNTDPTVPLPFGRAPGNGAMVGLLERSTGRSPVVIGKPQPALFEELMHRAGTRNALVIGDRLDTDIDGAIAAGVSSLLVCTGVHGTLELAERPLTQWPTYVARDLRSLAQPVVSLTLTDGRWQMPSDDPVAQAVLAAARRAAGEDVVVPPVTVDGAASPLIDLSVLAHGSVAP